MNHTGFAEYADVAFHNIEEVYAEGNHLLRIKGLIFHSSIIADHVELHHRTDTVRILVSMALTRPGGSGLFEIFVPIPQRVAAVTFGTERKLLWAREPAIHREPAELFGHQNAG